MVFGKYQHIERLGTVETDGIMYGTVHVFPKIDGTNGSVWWDDKLHLMNSASRNRVLTPENDNAGFSFIMCQYGSPYTKLDPDIEYQEQAQACAYLLGQHTNLKLYGEWLVPHTLKTYEDSAWRTFYVFDVLSTVETEEGLTSRYMAYEEYQPLLEEFGIEYIPPMRIINNPTTDQLYALLDKNDYLMKPGEIGEGIVIKNYAYRNKFGRQTWAKVVRQEFLTQHVKTMGAPEMNGQLTGAVRFVNEYCTDSLIDKVYASIVVGQQGWSSKHIPRLLSTVYHDLVSEDTWHAVKKFKNPIIDFKQVQGLVIQRIKEHKSELFV